MKTIQRKEKEMNKRNKKKSTHHAHITMGKHFIKRLNTLSRQVNNRSEYIRLLIHSLGYEKIESIVKKRHSDYEERKSSYATIYGKKDKSSLTVFLYKEQKDALIQIGNRYPYTRTMYNGKSICSKDDVVDIGLIFQWVIEDLEAKKEDELNLLLPA